MLAVWSKDNTSTLIAGMGLTGSVRTVGGDLPPNPEGSPVLLCLGQRTVDYFSEKGIVPKNRTITSLRHTTIKAIIYGQEVTLLFSYSPNISLSDYAKYVDLQGDFSKAFRLYKTGSIEPEKGDYQYVLSFKAVCNQLRQRIKAGEKKIDISLDLETLGLDPYFRGGPYKKGKVVLDLPPAFIVTVQVSIEIGQSRLVYFKSRQHWDEWLKDNYSDLEYLLNCPDLVLSGANLKYDLHWLYRHGNLTSDNFAFDTTLVGSLLDENRSNGLDNHTKIYAPELGGYSDIFDKTVDKGLMHLVDKESMLWYAGGDTDATLRVKKAMRAELAKDKALTKFYINILHPAARAFEKIEQGGIHLDMDRFNALESEVKSNITGLVRRAEAVLGGRIIAKHRDHTKADGINLTKASLLNDYMFSPMGLNLKPKMFTESTKLPSSALEHLEMFAEVPEAAEFIKILKEYGSATKTLSTYIVGFRKHIRSDGRFHPAFWFFAGNRDNGDGGTVTGRLSVKDPAFQTLPKHTDWGKKIRACYTAPPGYVVCEEDYAQGELKIVACVANEAEMLQTYLNNEDLHAKTGGGMKGLSYAEMMALQETDPDTFDVWRQSGKPVNFGLLYGMSASGLVDYARSNYGVIMTLSEAEGFRNAFFNLYPNLLQYHEVYKKLAHRDGKVTSPLGRIRHLPLINSRFNDIRSGAERQAINSPIQSALSDMLLWAVALGDAEGLTKHAPYFGAIHDATYSYVPEDKVDIYVPRQIEIMENLPFHLVGWNPQLKFTADAKIGPSMGELKKYKIAA